MEASMSDYFNQDQNKKHKHIIETIGNSKNFEIEQICESNQNANYSHRMNFNQQNNDISSNNKKQIFEDNKAKSNNKTL